MLHFWLRFLAASPTGRLSWTVRQAHIPIWKAGNCRQKLVARLRKKSKSFQKNSMICWIIKTVLQKLSRSFYDLSRSSTTLRNTMIPTEKYRHGIGAGCLLRKSLLFGWSSNGILRASQHLGFFRDCLYFSALGWIRLGFFLTHRKQPFHIYRISST